MVTGGEHEASKFGFRMLIEDCDLDIQPDVGWCGGMTELIKIGNMAEAHGKYVIPHGSSIQLSLRYNQDKLTDHRVPDDGS